MRDPRDRPPSDRHQARRESLLMRAELALLVVIMLGGVAAEGNF